ncbi:PH domain-containing protein [Nakamurella sp.]|uniref:PH domain-containing protein n=1 Tax=Nakamurella sp. TaxID=1869182 RepID=UPI003783C3BF
MPYPDNLLVTGEKIYVRKRPHWKVLVLPFIFFVLIIGGCAALLAFLNGRDWPSWATWAIVAVAVIALFVLVLVPFIRWRTEHFVISSHHIFFRTGLLSRREHQIPLGQIANIETEVTFWGRLMGFGSLIVESSADQPLKFRNVANLSKVQSMLNQLIRDEKELLHRGHMEVDDWAAGDSPDDRDRQARPGPDPAGAHHAGQSGTGQWPAQQGAPPGGQPAYGQPYGQSAYGQGYPPPAQGYPPPGQTQGYPPPGGPGYPPPGYQQTPGYPPNYPPQAGYSQGYPPPAGGYPPPAGYPAEGAPGYPASGHPQGYQQPSYPPPAAAWGAAPSSSTSPGAGEPPASAEPTVYTRSPAAGAADMSGDDLNEPAPTVLTRSPIASGSAPSGSGSATDAASATPAGGPPSRADTTAPGEAGATRGRHAQPTGSTPLPNFDEPDPTVMLRSPTVDAAPPGEDGAGPAGPAARP